MVGSLVSSPPLSRLHQRKRYSREEVDGVRKEKERLTTDHQPREIIDGRLTLCLSTTNLLRHTRHYFLQHWAGLYVSISLGQPDQCEGNLVWQRKGNDSWTTRRDHHPLPTWALAIYFKVGSDGRWSSRIYFFPCQPRTLIDEKR